VEALLILAHFATLHRSVPSFGLVPGARFQSSVSLQHAQWAAALNAWSDIFPASAA
jgi:hypothetical protein